MKKGITTSVRLPTNIRNHLELASYQLHRGKNWIIVQALEEYLTKLDQLAEEARRQSLIASKVAQQDTWEEDTDTAGWI